MARVRIFIVLVLLALGSALVITSYAPRAATAVWVGGGSHGRHFSAAEPLNTTQQIRGPL